MYENGITSGEGRGRGRGRGRGLWRPPASNADHSNSVMVCGRGMWVRGDRLSNPGQSASSFNESWQQLNITTPQPAGNFQMCQQVKKEDWHTLSLLAKPPPPPPNPPQEPASSTFAQSKTPTIQQLAAQSPPPPPPPLPPLGLSASGASSSIRAMTVSSSPRPYMPPPFTTSHSPLRPSFTPKQGNLRMEMINRPKILPLFSQQELKQTFRSRLRNVRAQVNPSPTIGGSSRWLSPTSQINRSSVTYNNQSHSRRANKRPVNSPTDANDITSQHKTRPNGSPQKKKKKKKRKMDSEQTNKDNKHKGLVHPDLLQLKVDEHKSFAEQTDELLSQLEQSEADKKLRIEVMKDVAVIFSSYLPLVEPQIYGSTLTNIAFKSSDLDLFLYCPRGQPEYNFVSEKGKVMYKSSKFTNVIRVPRARVPVIKATHISTKIDVDISTMSGQAVCNSLLIKHLLSQDVRIRPLAMLISLWSKLNAITGNSRFTSYSIVLMLLYYLQKITPPFLPPLKEILYSENANWPSSFLNKPIENENKSNIAQLFKGFFSFYDGFNFEEVIISPYLGKEIPVSQFKNIDQLSDDDFSIYKSKLKNNTIPFMVSDVINVQDPMEHNVNTTKGVFPKLLKLFRRSCERFLHICQDGTAEERWLPTMLKQVPLKLTDEKKFEFVINYPAKDEEEWFENCKTDFRKLLKILLIRVSEEEFEHDEESTGTLHKDSFFAEANYNVFNKKFRFPLRMYITGIIHLNELQKQFEMVINRIQSPATLFQTRFTLEQQKEKGSVNVTIIDKNTTGLNSFLDMVTEFKRYCGKFLTDIFLNGKPTEDSVINGAKVSVEEHKIEKKTEIDEEKLTNESKIIKTEDQIEMDFVEKNDKNSMKKVNLVQEE